MILIFEVVNWELGLTLGIAFVASFMTAYAGFGGALIMVPLFTFLIGPIQAIALTAISGAFAYTHLIPASIKDAHWPELGPVAIGLLVSISIGSHFLVEIRPNIYVTKNFLLRFNYRVLGKNFRPCSISIKSNEI